MATSKQLAALKKARAARKKNLAKKKAPVKRKVSAKKVVRKKAAPKRKRNPVRKTANKYIMTLSKNGRTIGYWFSGHWDDTEATFFKTVASLKRHVKAAASKIPKSFGKVSIGYKAVKK